MKKHIFFCLYAILLFLNSFSILARQSNDSLELDSTIVHGKLSNGLSYYIKPTNDNSSKIDMRLIVKVGHHQEKNNQLEYAHLIEHLAFILGKNFSREKDSQLLDMAGIQLAEMNGHVFEDYTQFIVNVTKDNKKAIDLAFLFFQDIIWNLEWDRESFEKECISIINERSGGTYTPPIMLSIMEKSEITEWEPQHPIDYKRYMNTLPYESLIQFYSEWYRPELMSLVIVGDIAKVKEIETVIKDKFSKKGSIKKHKNPNIVNDYLNAEPKFLQKEYNSTDGSTVDKAAHLRFYIPQKLEEKDTGINDLKARLLRELFVKMLNSRYKQRQNNYNTTFNTFAAFLSPSLALRIQISLFKDEEEGITKEAYETLLQIKQFGFTKDEFNKHKQELLLTLYNTDTRGTSYWKNEIINYSVYNTPLPAEKQKILGNLLEQLKVEEFNDTIKIFLNESPKDIGILAPKGHSLLSYNEETVNGWFLEMETTPIRPYLPPKVANALLPPKEVQSLKQNNYKRRKGSISGTYEYDLKNGIRLILNSYVQGSESTNKKSKNISFQGYSERGINCFPKHDEFSAINAPSIVSNSGVGGLNKFELDAYLKEIGFHGNVTPYVTYNEVGIKGSFALEELETTLQLVYLYFTFPNKNVLAFEDWKQFEKSNNNNLIDLNYEDFISSIREVLPDDDYVPRGSKALEGLNTTSLARAMELYRILFLGSEEFTFLFTGDFPEEELLELCNKYLGNLPFKREKGFDCKDKNYHEWNIPKNQTIFNLQSVDPMKNSLVRLVYVSKIKDKLDWQERIKINMIRMAMRELLMRGLRFEAEQGGVYEAGAGMNMVQSHNYHEFYLYFSCLTEDADRLIMESKRIVDSLINAPIEKDLLENMKMASLHYTDHEDRYGDMLKKMHDNKRMGLPLIRKADERIYIASLTPQDIWPTTKNLFGEAPLIFKMSSL